MTEGTAGKTYEIYSEEDENYFTKKTTFGDTISKMKEDL